MLDSSVNIDYGLEVMEVWAEEKRRVGEVFLVGLLCDDFWSQ